MSTREPERYTPLFRIASGGMATVWIGAARGPLGFTSVVAIKDPHPHLLGDPQFRQTLLEEARLASRIRHANVVEVRDIAVHGDTVRLVMPYVEGASLSDLLAKVNASGSRLPAPIALRIVLDACHGLAAAHALTTESGARLELVHRDVSPQNVLVGVDGVARITDFGISRAKDSTGPATSDGLLKGKVGYMAPEYIEEHRFDARADVFAMGVVVWEALAGQRLFKGSGELDTMKSVLTKPVPPLSSVADVGNGFDPVLARALERSPERRTPSAAELAADLEHASRVAGLFASHADVGVYVRVLMATELTARRAALADGLAALGADAAPLSAAVTAVLPTVRGWDTTMPLANAAGATLPLAARVAATPTPTPVPTPTVTPTPTPTAMPAATSVHGAERRPRSRAWLVVVGLASLGVVSLASVGAWTLWRGANEPAPSTGAHAAEGTLIVDPGNVQMTDFGVLSPDSGTVIRVGAGSVHIQVGDPLDPAPTPPVEAPPAPQRRSRRSQ